MIKIFLLSFILPLSLFASIGKISAIVGTTEIQRNNINLSGFIGFEIEKNDIVSTNNESKVKIQFNDNTIVTIGKNSTLNIEEYIYDTTNPKNSKTNLNFFKGSFKTITGQIGKINKEQFKIKTKTASIGIRGTELMGDETRVICTSGAIIVTLENAQEVYVDANQMTQIDSNGKLTQPQPINEEVLIILRAHFQILSELINEGFDDKDNPLVDSSLDKVELQNLNFEELVDRIRDFDDTLKEQKDNNIEEVINKKVETFSEDDINEIQNYVNPCTDINYAENHYLECYNN